MSPMPSDAYQLDPAATAISNGAMSNGAVLAENPGLPRRLAAMFYDSLLVFAITFTATLVVVGIRVVLSSHMLQTGERAITGGYHYFLQAVLFISVGLFFSWFWTRTGQTLGMQTWRLRIDNVDGGRISWRQALIRFVVAFVSALCLGLGYLWILWDRDQCSWHDRVSGSRVVMLPKPASTKPSTNKRGASRR
jgi:uncharacterized RDD family membrane protein YckC